MGSCKRPQAFGPLDLEIIDRVYEAAWAQLEAQAPFRDRDKEGERGRCFASLCSPLRALVQSILTRSATR